MIKYRTYRGSIVIEPVEITRETDSSVYLGDRRYPKVSGSSSFFDTWEVAKIYLMISTECKLDVLRCQVKIAEDRLKALAEMKEPE